MTSAAITSLIIGIITSIAKVVGISKAALLQSFEEMHKGVSGGDLLADELNDQAQDDSDKLAELYSKLPK